MRSLTKFLGLYSILFSCVFAQTQPQSKDVAQIVASMSEFRDISAWKTRTGLIRFSADGKYLAVSAKKVDVVVYSTETGKVLSRIDGKGFHAFSFSADGKYAVAQNAVDGSMGIFEVESGKLVRSIRGLGATSQISKVFGGTGIINQFNGIFPPVILEMGQVPISNDWKSILVNKNDSEFVLHDFDTGEQKFELNHADYSGGKERAKIAMAILVGGGALYLGSSSNAKFSPKGTYLMIANGNREPSLWKATTGQLVAKFNSTARVMHHVFSPDETMVATTDYEGVTCVWDTSTGKLLSTIGSKKVGGKAAAWTADSSKIIVIPSERVADLAAFDPKTGAELLVFKGSAPDGALFSDNLKFVATRPYKNKSVLFQLWDVETGKLITTVPRSKDQDAISSIKWNPNDQYFVTSEGLKQEVKLWNTRGELLQVLAHSTIPMEFSSDGKFLATGGRLANDKTDIGYVWEFSKEPRADERIGMLR
ncbi:MAG: WD40 repeat domain-containing protein [Acidobacteria bacterium]|nr:WD40 repeat domain-containing protein [Acidobacteriota bacterium]